MFILKQLSRLLKNKPLKTILFTVLLIVVLAVGARNVEMATGNDTLVSSESDVYQDNLSLEKEFGGESIIVMYESEDQKSLLTIDNLKHMEGVEKQLGINENIYSIISPVMLLNQMAEKQSVKYQEGLSEVINGLDEMSGKLNNIGDNLIIKTESGNESQQKGTEASYEEQIKQFGIAIDRTASSMPTDNPQVKEQIIQLKGYSQKLIQLSEQLKQIESKPPALQTTDDMTSGQGKQIQQQVELKELGSGLKEMGSRLESISENMNNMQKYSDTLSPGLPETQKTLDYMIYDDEGQLKDMFNELVMDDRYMMMSIKFKGEVSDVDKSEVVESINSYLNQHSLTTTETFVSGKPVLDGEIESSMKDSMKKMMMLALIAMIIVLMITFKTRWRILPLGIVLIAIIGTIGIMGWVSIPITMVSMAVFPILIGLGIDYAIQFQSRYTEEMEEGEDHYEAE
ncbi:MMPL family transporter [Paenisporosarcina sp. TG-14]|uniref:MMPL family transporter n=1 Tax=Paenisporosarcina sp. TG-14 TaxID=1231057 RepID=UPI0002EA9012|nr:MMPL family transporter [Paenisporosarcina sp. TG-14]